MATHGITLLFQARDRISPEMEKIQKQLEQTKKNIKNLSDIDIDTGSFDPFTRSAIQAEKQIQKVSNSAEQMEKEMINSGKMTARQFVDVSSTVEKLKSSLAQTGKTRLGNAVGEAKRAENAIQNVRNEVQRLSASRADVEIHADTSRAESQISGLESSILALGGTVAAFSFAGLNSLMEKNSFGEASIQAKFSGIDRETLMETMRQTSQENPYLDVATIQQIALVAQKQAKSAGISNPSGFGMELAKGAANTKVVTGKDIEDIQKVQISLMNGFQGRSSKEIVDATTTIMSQPDLKGEVADSVLEYIPQFQKFSPDLGVLVETFKLISEMKIWSNDAAFDSIKESGIRLGNTGDLQNLLKTTYESQGLEAKKAQEKAESEAKYIQNGLRNGSDEEQRKIMTKLLMDFATIIDPVQRQQAMDSLAGGAGENVGKDLATFMLKFAQTVEKGKIEVVDTSAKVREAKLADPNFDVEQAKKGKETEEVFAQSSFQDSISEFSKAVENFKTSIYSQITQSNGGLIAAAGGGAMAAMGGAGVLAAGVAGGGLIQSALSLLGLGKFVQNQFEKSPREVEKREILSEREEGIKKAKEINDEQEKLSHEILKNEKMLKDSNTSNPSSLGHIQKLIEQDKSRYEELDAEKRTQGTRALINRDRANAYEEKYGKLPHDDFNAFKRGKRMFNDSKASIKGKGFIDTAKNFGSSMMEKAEKIPWKKVGAASLITTGAGIVTSLATGDFQSMAEQIVAAMGGAAGGVIGSAIGTAIMPVVGTTIGGLVGSYFGAEGLSSLFQKFANPTSATTPNPTMSPTTTTTSMPVEKATQEIAQSQKPQTVTQNVNVPNISVNISVDGILANTEELIQQLNSSSVRSTISNILTSEISKAIDTKAGVPTSVPVPSIRRLGGAMA